MTAEAVHFEMPSPRKMTRESNLLFADEHCTSTSAKLYPARSESIGSTRKDTCDNMDDTIKILMEFG